MIYFFCLHAQDDVGQFHHVGEVGNAHHVGHVHLIIVVSVTGNSVTKVCHNVCEVTPLARRLVCTQIFGQHMQGPIFGHIIKDTAAQTDLRRIGIGINPRQAVTFVERTDAD